MQTFLPVPNFTESALILDKKRCWKQVVEAKQILRCLYGQTDGWKNHPAVKMWKSYENSLCKYYNEFLIYCLEYHKINTSMCLIEIVTNIKDPPWLGDNSFHSSHRSNLLRKDPKFYGRYGWTELPTLPYFWPLCE